METGLKRSTITDSKRRKIQLVVDEDELIIEAFYKKQSIGSISFSVRDHDYYPGQDYLKLTWCFLDKLGTDFVRCGIGTKMVKRMLNVTGHKIVVLNCDESNKSSDGSYPTGNALQFFNSLVRKKLGVCE